MQLRWILSAIQRSKHPELWELYLEDRRMPLVLQRILKKGSCAVDVGGHIGSFLKLLTANSPGGQHIAFEPSATKSKWLKSRFPEVKVFSFAVSNKTGHASFEENYARSGYSTLQRQDPIANANVARYEVQTCRLDDVLVDLGPFDLIKLDIEGGELDALRGAFKLIEKWHPAIIFECAPEHRFAEQKQNRMDLYDFVTKQLHYKIFSFADFLFGKGEMTYDEFRKCGLYPFRALNFVALPRSSDELRVQ